MKHADVLAERVLFLDGLPNFQAIGRLKVGETVEEILKADLALEMEAIPMLRDAIEYSESVRDYVSREIFGAHPRKRGGARRFPRDAVRHDCAHGPRELRAAQLESGRRGRH